MLTLVREKETKSMAERLPEIVREVCGLMAPNWPLDKSIAVNPLWGMRNQAFPDSAARLSVLAGVQCVMPASYWLSKYREGAIDDESLQHCARQAGLSEDIATLVTQMKEHGSASKAEPWHSMTHLMDQHWPANFHRWHERIIQQISQCCAHLVATNDTLPENANAFYRTWREAVCRDKSVSLSMGAKGIHALAATLPDTLDELWRTAVAQLDVPDTILADYLHSLLLDVNGWASYFAYCQWQGKQDLLPGLLAARLGWELLLWQFAQRQDAAMAKRIHIKWGYQSFSFSHKVQRCKEQQNLLWVCWRAYELTQQMRLQQQLLRVRPVEISQVQVQAVFCIDVRSEVIRRALEQQSEHIQTMGFAGFFGIPIAFQPSQSALRRPQLPGLLTSSVDVTPAVVDMPEIKKLQRQAHWQTWSKHPASSFSMVESFGWWYAFKLLKQSLFPSAHEPVASSLTHTSSWCLTREGQPLSLADKITLACNVLNAMKLTQFAATVLLVGHSGQCSNNLQAASLDCGACGGQSGEVNVRVLAQLLNDDEVRAGVAATGIDIPLRTRFIAALHNTTTDEISCFDESVPRQVKQWLESACYVAQKERARHLEKGWAQLSEKERHRAFLQRARDWSQVRPEWGLAGNHSLIIAPRSWTRSLNLGGKVFLHDYRFQQDQQLSVLELLMTAPMIVAHWINMQYNLSVSAPEKFGSGNKVLHNAIGDIGVLEGNAGDLRIGLALQSVHDGEDWVHQPQRLAVYIAAPTHAIEAVLKKHELLRELIDNEWLYVFSWFKPAQIERFFKGQWVVSSGLTC